MRTALEYLFVKEPYLATVLTTLIARDITTKLYTMNTKVWENIERCSKNKISLLQAYQYYQVVRTSQFLNFYTAFAVYFTKLYTYYVSSFTSRAKRNQFQLSCFVRESQFN